MYVITGATGNTGSVIAVKLLEAGKKVRVIGRDEKRLKTFGDRGAEMAAGSLTDSKFLKQAFQGALAAYVMVPPNMQVPDFTRYQDETGESIVEALKDSEITHVVHLSSAGADLPSGTGPIAGLYRQENRLNNLDRKNVLHLRPGYFFENLLMNIPMIQGMGIIGSAVKPDIPIPMIATKDVGNYAAERLIRLDFSGKSHRDLGQNLTFSEVTRAIGEAIGKPDLQYVQFSYEDEEKGMIDAGLPPDLAGLYSEMSRALNELLKPVKQDSKNTPTSIQEFARTVFAPAYNS